jgi:hypothetical protein
MTVGDLLARASSAELTEWQAYWKHLAKVEGEKNDGRRISWRDDDDE